jgi:Na+-transporting methylmalonyl-CoA/oxaloacetate decarboxylase gamma subunit
VAAKAIALTGSMLLTLALYLLRLGLVLVFVTLQLLQVVTCYLSGRFGTCKRARQQQAQLIK